MKKFPQLIKEILAAVLILLFVYTGLSKWINLSSFKLTLSQSPLIGNYSESIAITLPLVELIISGLLFFPKHRENGFISSTLIMIVFTAYIAYMLFYAVILPCSCGGVLQILTWSQHLILNCFFTIISGIGWAIESRDKKKHFKSLLQ